MDSQDEDRFDVDAELNAWLDKEAEFAGLDPSAPYGNEAELIRQWQANPTPEGFEQLYNSHQNLIHGAASGYLQSTTLPKSAVKGFAIQRYTKALQGYDPDRGAQFKTYLYREMQRVGRYLGKYQNFGRIPEDRTSLISLYNAVEPALKEQLGRDPTDIEISDEMKLSTRDIADLKKARINPKTIGTLRKELRRDMTAEQPGGEAEVDSDSKLRRQIVFLHGSLNPEQQLVLEHTYEGFGKPVILDDNELGRTIGMSPQKIRAIKSQIKKKVDRFW